MRPTWILTICAMASLASGLRADVSLIGTTSGKFLQLGASARPAALAEAYVALADDAAGFLYNPAGMAGVEQVELQASHTEWFKGARVENLAGIFPLSTGSWGGSLSVLLLPTQVRTSQVGPQVAEDGSGSSLGNFRNTGEFTPFDMRGTVGWAPVNWTKLKAGMALNVISEQIDGNLSMGLSADFGALFESGLKGLNFGLAVQNLGLPASMINQEVQRDGNGNVKVDASGNTEYTKGSGFLPPLDVRMGTAYRLLDESLILTAEADLPIDNELAYAAGVEYRIGGGIYLRAGMRADSIFNPWTAGIGAKLWNSMFDLATSSAGELGQTYRGSVSFHFGGLVTEGRGADLRPENDLVSVYTREKAFRLDPLVEPHRKVAKWILTIRTGGSAPQVIRQFEGVGRPTRAVDWDGKTNSGVMASQGSYYALLGVTFADGHTEYSPYKKLTLDSTLPEAKLEFDPASVDPANESRLYVPALLNVRTPDAKLRLKWRLEIVGQDNAVFQKIEGNYGDADPIVWQGLNDSGKQFVSNSMYRFRVTVLDADGKVLKQQAEITKQCVFRQ